MAALSLEPVRWEQQENSDKDAVMGDASKKCSGSERSESVLSASTLEAVNVPEDG